MPRRYSNLFNCSAFLSLFPCVIVYFKCITSFWNISNSSKNTILILSSLSVFSSLFSTLIDITNIVKSE